jgi:hypothetical protein
LQQIRGGWDTVVNAPGVAVEYSNVFGSAAAGLVTANEANTNAAAIAKPAKID